jgi:DNA-binding YbaB/EbfC family protein
MNIAAMMKQAQAMQSKMQSLQAELAEMLTEGQAGGGLVKIVLTGKGDCRSISIDPSLLQPSEQAMVQDLLVVAHADAKQKIDATLSAEMSKLTGGMNLPAGFKLPF